MTATPTRPIGCQARPWLQTLGRETFTGRLPEIMKEIDAAGFAGFETALDCLPVENPDAFTDARNAAGGLTLAAAHTGGRWWEPEMAGRVLSVATAAAQLPALGCSRLMVSIGGEAVELDDTGLRELAANLTALAAALVPNGVEVAIHNHAHELAGDARILDAIFDVPDAEHLKLGADLGWVAFAGWDPVAFLRRFGDRVSYLHVRDLAERDGKRGFIEVGQGTLDWPAIVAALDEIGYAGWLVAESEFTSEWLGQDTPPGTAKLQYDGIAKITA